MEKTDWNLLSAGRIARGIALVCTAHVYTREGTVHQCMDIVHILIYKYLLCHTLPDFRGSHHDKDASIYQQTAVSVFSVYHVYIIIFANNRHVSCMPYPGHPGSPTTFPIVLLTELMICIKSIYAWYPGLRQDLCNQELYLCNISIITSFTEFYTYFLVNSQKLWHAWYTLNIIYTWCTGFTQDLLNRKSIYTCYPGTDLIYSSYADIILFTQDTQN